MPSSVLKWTLRSLTSSRATQHLARGGEPLPVGHPRVEERVDDVHDQVGYDDEERAEQDGALDHRKVGVLDAVVGEAPDARDVEDGLDQDRAAQEDADVEPE